ncbi:hypothetical protein DCAR_0625474 [Daucus carota subsp. sativus]|uniref:Uncharacterized protein n=1 Tax=Daucus carota subsp. sativus TaxID=79200 RepID=A0AAF1B7F2_DAUCS|nr:PREDICTED: uncharacterized protein LOC108226959 [Daucus carota subsp. sativus]WOH06051.1 hypothetical protein DCAR_0625474 [Daucus carota subsp. sativus]
MEGKVGLKTVECLRGRLLAERRASRAANQDAEHLRQKLIELESQLRREIKLRDRAEEKLKSLIEKLESSNRSSSVSYGSVLSDFISSSGNRSCESGSVSSSTASNLYAKCIKDDDSSNTNSQTTNSTKPESVELMTDKDFPLSESLMHNVITNGATESPIILPSNEHTESDKAISEKSHDFDTAKEMNGKRRDDCSYVKPVCRVH